MSKIGLYDWSIRLLNFCIDYDHRYSVIEINFKLNFIADIFG